MTTGSDNKGKSVTGEWLDLSANQLLKKARHFVNTRLLLRARLMFLVPVPLLFMGLYSAVTGSAVEMMGRFTGFALLMAAAWLQVDGQIAKHAYDEREIARPPAIPRKLFAAVLTTLAMVITAGLGFVPVFNDPVTIAVYAAVIFLFYLFSFGLDPMRAKGLRGYSPKEAERLLQALEQGERLMSETMLAADRFANRSLQHQVRQLVEEARGVFRAIEKDPRDLPRARKFMAVYLQGAHDATLKLAKLKSHHPTQEYDDYQRLLVDLRQHFSKQKAALLQNDRTELDVEVEVLRDRIKQEG